MAEGWCCYFSCSAPRTSWSVSPSVVTSRCLGRATPAAPTYTRPPPPPPPWWTRPLTPCTLQAASWRRGGAAGRGRSTRHRMWDGGPPPGSPTSGVGRTGPNGNDKVSLITHKVLTMGGVCGSVLFGMASTGSGM